MILAFVLLLALVLAAIAYAALLEHDLPPELDWLRPQAPVAQKAPAAPPQQQAYAKALAPSPGSTTRWRLLSDGRLYELSKDFEDAPLSGNQRYAAPAFVLTCLDGRWYARLEPRLRLQQARPGQPVSIEIGGRRATAVGTATTAVQLDTADAVLPLFRAGKPLSVTLNYRDIGPQVLTFVPTGFTAALESLPAACR
jgi:hypothetical protein